MTDAIFEPSRQVPVIHEADVCVLGGSCTGVFAAIRAARLGASVVLVEKANCFGGVATLSLVNVWHSPFDTTFERPIIGGLTLETIDRLRRRDAVTDFARSPSMAWAFNSCEMQIELDEMVREARVVPMLHTLFVAPHVEDGQLKSVLVENKSGRGAIAARFFIDATGDADLCHRLDLPTYVAHGFLPSTTCAAISDYAAAGQDAGRLNGLIGQHAAAFGLPEGFAWGVSVPGSSVYMLAGTRVYKANAAEADELTHSEMEGRRQVRGIMDLLRHHVPGWQGRLQALPARIGIRETRHVRCAYQLTGHDVLWGQRFDDAIANGSYRVDVHHQDKPGITFRYLDGTQVYSRPGSAREQSRWRDPLPVDPTFYQIPFGAMVPGHYGNLLVAGRMIDADPEAHAGIRVMVNMNQTGEAAGVAAVLALRAGMPIDKLDVAQVRQELRRGGSIVI
ncbi:MAG: FAD-dependent oxidoreductase [Phycisphaeraceae bacterium]